MWYLQRDDVYKRNEWSNYTNWAYEDILPKSMEKLEIRILETLKIDNPYK